MNTTEYVRKAYKYRMCDRSLVTSYRVFAVFGVYSECILHHIIFMYSECILSVF